MRRVLAVATLLLAVPALAQIRNIPASVTDFHPGARFSGAPLPLTTSVGPHGTFGGTFPNNGVRFSGFGGFGFHHRHHPGFGGFGFGFGTGFGAVAVPVYVPVYPYPVFMGDAGDYAADAYAAYLPYTNPRPSYPVTYDQGGRPPMPAPSVDEEPPLPTAQQRVRDSRYGDHYTDSRDIPQSEAVTPAAAAPPAPEPDDTYPATVLVFKDGHRVEMHNYAIVGDFVFDLTRGHPRKYALADLDLAATTKANDDNGVDFRLPNHRPSGD